MVSCFKYKRPVNRGMQQPLHGGTCIIICKDIYIYKYNTYTYMYLYVWTHLSESMTYEHMQRNISFMCTLRTKKCSHCNFTYCTSYIFGTWHFSHQKLGFGSHISHRDFPILSRVFSGHHRFKPPAIVASRFEAPENELDGAAERLAGIKKMFVSREMIFQHELHWEKNNFDTLENEG